MRRSRRLRQALKFSARRLLQLLARGGTRHVRVLTFHSIDDSGSLISVTRDEFRDQLALLRELGIQGLTAAQFTDQTLYAKQASECPSVLITFDDGYENFIDGAMPLLREFGFPATVFIVPQLMGLTALWYQRDAISISNLLSKIARSREEVAFYLDQMRPLNSARLMTWEQAKQIVDAGFDVGSHSNEHYFLTSLTDEQLTLDLSQSRELIREKLQTSAELVCYPYGDCDARVARIAQQVGYRIGFCVDPSSRSAPMQLGRWSVGPGLGAAEFRYLFSRAADIEESLRRRVASGRA